MVPHCVKMLARDLGETPNWPSAKTLIRRSKNAHCSSNEPHCESNGRLCDLFLPLFNKSEGPAFHTFAAVHYTLELTLDKKKFLFVSLDGLIADIAWQVVKEATK